MADLDLALFRSLTCGHLWPSTPGVGYKKFWIEAGPVGIWTVLDAAYEPHELVQGFLVHLQTGRSRSSGTGSAYAGDLALYLNWLETTRRTIAEGPEYLDRFVVHLRTTPIPPGRRGAGRPRAASRINRVLVAVREFYKWAPPEVRAPALPHLFEVTDNRFLPAELKPEGQHFAYVARPRHMMRTPKVKFVKAASPDEFEALVRACMNARDRFLLVALWFTGLRLGEALGLRLSDLHFAPSSRDLDCAVPGPHLHVVKRRNVNKAEAKSIHPRHVPVESYVLRFYELYCVERDLVAADCDYVFVNIQRGQVGAPLKAGTVEDLFARLSKRAQLARSITPHMLRHGTGTDLVENGEALEVVQELLGHRSITSTQVYTHPSESRKRSAVRAAERRRQERGRKA